MKEGRELRRNYEASNHFVSADAEPLAKRAFDAVEEYKQALEAKKGE